MRITRTITAVLSTTMLAFSLFACESEEKKPPKAEPAAAEQPSQGKAASPKKEAISSPEEVAKKYLKARFSGDLETQKKVTTRDALEDVLRAESGIKMMASQSGMSFEEAIKMAQEQAAAALEVTLESATKISEQGIFAKVSVSAIIKMNDMPPLPTQVPVELAKDDGVWKVMTPIKL